MPSRQASTRWSMSRSSPPAGVDADPALLDRIAAGGVVVSVTAGSIPDGSPPHPAIAQRMAAILANHGQMFRAGATMVPGADAGVSPGKPHDVLPYALRAHWSNGSG
jgi:predicted amidohydrolase YtcJ